MVRKGQQGSAKISGLRKAVFSRLPSFSFFFFYFYLGHWLFGIVGKLICGIDQNRSSFTEKKKQWKKNM